MQTYTFSGETPAEAMQKARDELGDNENVVLIQSREVRKKTLNQPALYEMVFGVIDEQDDMESAESNQDERQDGQIETIELAEESSDDLPDNSIKKRLERIAQREIEQKKREKSFSQIFDDEDVALELSDAIREIREISQAQAAIKPKTSTPKVAQKPQAKVESSDTKEENKDSQDQTKTQQKAQDSTESKESSDPKDPNLFEKIQKELFKLNDKIKLIQNTLWSEKSPKNLNIQIPTEFAEIYRITKESGMKTEHLEEIMRLSIEYMPLKMREQSETIKKYFRGVLRKMIYCKNELESDRKIVMLVGPTGVGKTTTLAKLAARYSQILPDKKKVGIITLDDYRIGAMDQLAWYARKMRLSIDSVSDPDDLFKKIESLRYCDYILIDTAGHSQHDKQKIQELKKFIQNDEFKIDITLVLSAVTKYDDLKDCYDAFGELDISNFIFSKLDEARGLGNIFSLVYESKKPISYLSIGQEVPDDIIVADNSYLADCLLNGFFYPNSK